MYALSTALLEESIARGLLLPAMRKAWGDTPKGLILSALISGFFWASLHFFNLLIRPFPVVFLQVISMTLVGFYYAIFTISGRSIWPAVVLHWAVNSALNLALNSNPNFQETITHHLGYAAVSLLPVLVGLWVLQPNWRTYELQSTTLSESI
jgi:membrane protease YdiL (CAAX protease family)